MKYSRRNEYLQEQKCLKEKQLHALFLNVHTFDYTSNIKNKHFESFHVFSITNEIGFTRLRSDMSDKIPK